MVLMRKLGALLNFTRLFEVRSDLLGFALDLVRPEKKNTMANRLTSSRCARSVHRLFVVGQIFATMQRTSVPGGSAAPAGSPLDWSTSAPLLSLRRKACSTLVQLASAIPATLLPLFSTLASRVQQMMADGTATDAERTFLLEALVLVSQAVPSAGERREFLSTVCDPLVREMSAQDLAAALADTTTFQAALGITDLCRRGRR